MYHLVPRAIGFFCVLSVAAAATNIDLEIILTPHAGAAREDREIVRWQERAAAGGAGAEVFERLAWAYIAKARHTLDAGYYKLAEKTVDVMDARFGASAESRLLRGHVFHNVHRFRDAEAMARRLVADRGQPADLALLSDALMEQGKLAEVAAVLQRLVDLKPGVEAFSRIAHFRWLKGDLAGAIAAMDSAQHASSPRDAETQAWVLMRLSAFRLQQGELALALKLAGASLEHVSAYPAGLLAQGRALIALGRNADAIEPLQRAEQLQPLPEYQWWLADALALIGRDREAAVVEQRLVDRGADSDPRTLALFLATRRRDVSEAVRIARAERQARDDVFSRDAVAWCLWSADEVEAAHEEMQRALAEQTKDARLLLHAGEIANACGESAEAAKLFAEAAVAAGTLTPSERARLAQRTQVQRGLGAQ